MALDTSDGEREKEDEQRSMNSDSCFLQRPELFVPAHFPHFGSDLSDCQYEDACHTFMPKLMEKAGWLSALSRGILKRWLIPHVYTILGSGTS